MALGVQLFFFHSVGGVEIHQHEVCIVAGLQLALGKAQDLCRAGAHQVHQQFQRQAFFPAELGVADPKGGLAAHHTGHALQLVFLGVGSVVGGNGIHHTGTDAIDERLHIIRSADGRVDPVIAGLIVEPQVMRGHLTGHGCAAQLCHLDGLQRATGGNVAHVQPGLVVLAQPAVTHSLQVFSQPVIPGADLHILSVAHHSDIPLGADGKGPGHGGVVLHTVAILGDELHAGGQGLEVVDGLAVKVLGDGNSLVHIAQAHLGGLLFHHGCLCGRGADRLGVGHQVDKGVAACGRSHASGGNVLLIFKARGAPVAVQVHKGRQHGQTACIEDSLPLPGQCGKILTHGGDLSVFHEKLHRAARSVYSVDEQHILLPPCSYFGWADAGIAARGQAKKRTFPQTEKFKKRKKETRSPPQKRLQTAFSVQHSFLTAFVRFSFSFAFVFVIFYHRNAKCVNAFCKIPV